MTEQEKTKVVSGASEVSEILEKEIVRKVGRPKGGPKYGGRKKGTKNKNSANFKEALDKSGYNLVEETLKTLEEIRNPRERLGILLGLYKYIYPALKESEVIQDLGGTGEGFDGIDEDRLVKILKEA